LRQQKLAVESGYWPLYRFHPDGNGESGLQLDSKAPKIPLADYVYNETRYKMLTKTDPLTARRLLERAQAEVNERWKWYEHVHAFHKEPQTTE
jgi:pyruvate-ferredoxin/flavodoxin oxidoreductase